MTRTGVVLSLMAATLGAVAVSCDDGGVADAPSRPETATSLVAGTLAIDIPEDPRGVMRIADVRFGVTVAVELLGPVDRSDVWIETTPFGVEDFVRFHRRPSMESLRYRISLDGVAGLRLVERVLEILDATGTPRIRMAAPWIADASGRPVPVGVAIRGCAVDDDPRPPWGRAPRLPGARACEIELEWGGRGVTYPAILDPAWTTAGAMVEPRHDVEACPLASGRALVAGGRGAGFDGLSSAEVFDPVTRTWAVTGAMAEARRDAPCARLDDGRVLVVSGSNAGNPGAFPTSEAYDPALGTWEPPVACSPRFAGHTLTKLPDGRVVLAGGDIGGGGSTAVETFDPATNSWAASGELATSRTGHAAALLASGRILVAGGQVPLMIASATTELFDPDLGSAVPGAPMLKARVGFTLVARGDDIVAVGGTTPQGGTSTVEAYDIATEVWSEIAPLPYPLTDQLVVALDGGRILAPPGGPSGALLLAGGAWLAAGEAEPRHRAIGFSIPGGLAVVAGGWSTDVGGVTGLTRIFEPLAAGAVCDGPGECASTFCKDGRCCGEPCDGPCRRCTTAGTCALVIEGPDDGCGGEQTCGPGGVCAGVQGSPCGDPVDCASGFCVDGACCDQGCDAPCETCGGAVPGVCALAVGAPGPGRQPCPIAYACNGVNTECVPISECRDGHLIVTADAPDLPLDCAPYACSEAGTCKSTCNDVFDCAAPYVCDSYGECVTPTPTASGPGCATHPREDRYGGVLALAIALALAMRRRCARGAARQRIPASARSSTPSRASSKSLLPSCS